MDVSIVVPLFNEEESLPELCEWINRVLTSSKLSYELILVDDGSVDRTPAILSQLAARDDRIRPLRLAKRYGASYFKQDFTNIRYGDIAKGHESRTRAESLLRGLPAEQPEGLIAGVRALPDFSLSRLRVSSAARRDLSTSKCLAIWAKSLSGTSSSFMR